MSLFDILIALNKDSNYQTLDSAFRRNPASKTKKLKTHFVFAHRPPFADVPRGFIFDDRSHFVEGVMMRYHLKSAMLTTVSMVRDGLITKENMEKIRNRHIGGREHSVNDDIESFFEDILLGNNTDNFAPSNYLPMLTEEEMELVEIKDPNYMATFWSKTVDKYSFKASASDSKFVNGYCHRHTRTINYFQ